ncbi:MAG: pyrophosphatase [Pseudomonadota bacterium]|nr:pyrophosphatase [Pseudomonadota bacterium]
MLKALQARFDEASLSYCDIHGLDRDTDWVMLKLLEEIGELTQVWNTRTGRGRDKGHSDTELLQAMSDEIADALGMLLILAHQHGLDLEGSIARKWRFDPTALMSPSST